MEVHHHTHTSRKKWTHYFWEFLMLFLAVFLGFMAENQREHFIEHRREKQFMISLVRDLELDTLQLGRLEQFRVRRLKIIDSLIVFFASHSAATIPAAQCQTIVTLFGHSAFFQNSGTIDQLKNAGGLRLIRRRNVVDSIQGYDQQMNRMELRDKYETEYSMFGHTTVVQKLIDGTESVKIFADTALFQKNPDLATINFRLNKEYLGEYLNRLLGFRTMVHGNRILQQGIKQKAQNLILLIKREYDLN